MTRRWVPDESSFACGACNRGFGYFARKHHCRVCGRVYCGDCTAHAVVPEVLREHLPNPSSGSLSPFLWSLVPSTLGGGGGGGAERLCHECLGEIEAAGRLETLLNALVLCDRLTILDWAKIRHVSDDFARVVDLLQAMWRRIQYTAHWAGEHLSQMQVSMLRANSRFLGAHAHWYVVALHAGLAPPLGLRGETAECRHLLCNRHCCGARLAPAECIEILLTSVLPQAREAALAALLQTDELTLRCFATTLVFVAATSPRCITQVLVPLATRDATFAHKCFWRARSGGVVCGVVKDRLLAAICPEVRTAIVESEAWAQSFQLAVGSAHSPSYRRTIMAPWEGKEPCLPGHPTYRVVRARVEHSIVKNSSSCPLVVPVVLRNAATGETEEHHLMYKRDTPLLTDSVVLDAIRFINLTARQDLATRYPMVSYHVLPLSENTGLVLLVPRSRTLYSIACSKTDLLNHVLDLAPGRPASQVRDQFAASAAFSATTALALGIGDRHLANIMVCGEGNLFHIDFSYALGAEPGIKAPLAKLAPRLRLTSQIVMALGGTESAHFADFKHHCSELFHVCKRQAMSLYYILYALVAGDVVRADHLRSFLMGTLAPGQTAEEARLEIDARITNATNYRTVDTVLDTIFHWTRGI